MFKTLRRLAPVLVLAACATSRAEPALDPLSRGLVALSADRWSGAEASMLEAASRCESGRSGVEALLLLATTALQPGNPERDPDRAAFYAAHAIRLPDVDAVDLELAEAIYLMAIELGARPEGRTVALPARSLAPRFSACGRGGVTATVPRPLPTHPGTPLAVYRDRANALLSVLDSVGIRVEPGDPGSPQGGGGGDEVVRLRGRVQALEAELARIRRLLRQGTG